MSDENRGCFSCFGGSAKKESPAPVPDVTKVMTERAKSMSQDMARSTKTEDDDEFQLRLQGFDENDPEFKAAKEEKVKRRSQDMESKRKSQEEEFHKRLQGL
jgi:hypothetical protein